MQHHGPRLGAGRGRGRRGDRRSKLLRGNSCAFRWSGLRGRSRFAGRRCRRRRRSILCRRVSGRRRGLRCRLGGEAVVAFFFFLWTGGIGGSVRPTSLLPAPMLLAPVSSKSGGEVKASSAWEFGSLGAARPKLVFPPRGEAGDLPAPKGTGLE
jgi:hypothetical protein